MQHTPLYEQHLASNANMVDFHGWSMPLHYGSQIAEHHAVRKEAGMFDVSHMTVVDILGAGGRQFLLHLLANDIDAMKPGQALYSCMLNQHGCILDDLIVYYRSPDNYRLILNAATRDKDLEWLKEQAQGFAVGLQERSDLCLLAVQGPQAIQKTLSVLAPAQMDAVSTLGDFEAVDVGDSFFARTGYTGEAGLELVIPETQIVDLWEKLLAVGVVPCGLGARDSLRLEAGMMLYGQDMDATTTPYESGLAWTVKTAKEERDFMGKGALLTQKLNGVKYKMVGLVLEDKGMLRSGQKVLVAEGKEGSITSGGYSPTLEKSIAFARVPLEIGTTAEVEVRGKKLRVRVTKPRFVSRGKVLV